VTNRFHAQTKPAPSSFGNRTALKISLAYLAAGALWILFSDRLVDVLGGDIRTISRLQTVKGWLFILVTASCLYLFIRRVLILLEQSQQESNRQKERMDEASRAVQVTFWEWEIPSGRLSWSDAIGSLLGYEPGTFPRTIQAWEGIIHPEDLPLVRKCLQDHIDQDTPYDVEYRVRKTDQTYAWWHDQGVVSQRDDQGKAYQMFGICRDITRHKLADRAIFEIEERFRQVADNAGVFIWEVDTAGLYRYCSSASERVLGYPPSELVGRRHFYDLFPPDRRERQKEAFLSLFERRNPFQGYVNSYLHRNGSTVVILETAGSPLLDEKGGLLGYYGVDRDITERMRNETQMQRHNAYLEALHETALGLMRRTDLTGLFQAIVLWATRFTGSDEGWIAIRVPQEDHFEFKAAIGPLASQIGVCFETGRGIAGEVWRTQRSVVIENYQRWPRKANIDAYRDRRATMAVPLKSEGRIAGVLGLSHHDPGRQYDEDDQAMLERFAELASIALDNARLYEQMKQELTERKRMEAERDQIQNRLLQSQKMEALGTMAGGVAHDLNNVLGVLVGYAELFLEKIPETSPQRRYARSILQSGLRGAAIINDLLTLARRGVAVSEVVNLNQVITDYFKTPEFETLRAHHPQVTFRSDLEKDLLNTRGSPVHLGKTVMNLIVNAAEAISGAGAVAIGTRNRHLDRPTPGCDGLPEGDYVVMTVSDDGRGISTEDIGKIFEPFYTKKVMGRSGTGLGLAVVWGAVKDHNGTIEVQSEEGKGSRFTIILPACREPSTVVEEAPSIETYLSRGESILVVDDVKEQRELASGMLERLGYRVTALSSGEEAIDYLRTGHADLVVLDMIMEPGMDGLETYQSILKIHPGQKAIIVSGFAETDRVGMAQAQGAGPYIRKPYVLQKIGLAIRRELDRPIP
jgi:PAS domain S-box-containing protein